MRIAIPVFRTRIISPRFDVARRLLLVDLHDGNVVEKREISFDLIHPLKRIQFLKDQGIQALLCGGIRRCDRFELEEMGITVYAPLFGEIEDILNFCVDGTLRPGHEIATESARRRIRNMCRFENEKSSPRRYVNS